MRCPNGRECLPSIAPGDIEVVPELDDDAAMKSLDVLIANSPEVQDALAKIIHQAYERGRRAGERAGHAEKHAELSRLVDGVARLHPHGT
jgi:hypothetical protein